MPGPPPTPTEILRLRGSWRANARKGEPHASPRRPKMPPWLDADAKIIWRKAVVLLGEMHVLCAIDQVALARYCTLVAWWLRSSKTVNSEGFTTPLCNREGVELGRGSSADFKVAMIVSAELGRIEQQFGLTPSARARLTLADSEQAKDAAKEAEYIRTG